MHFTSKQTKKECEFCLASPGGVPKKKKSLGCLTLSCRDVEQLEFYLLTLFVHSAPTSFSHLLWCVACRLTWRSSQKKPKAPLLLTLLQCAGGGTCCTPAVGVFFVSLSTEEKISCTQSTHSHLHSFYLSLTLSVSLCGSTVSTTPLFCSACVGASVQSK